MHYNSIVAYIIVIFFAMTLVLAEANKEREQFADLLQKRKHLNGYWVGKRWVVSSDEEPLTDAGNATCDMNCNVKHLYVVFLSV